jgi:hypothetical protein
MNRGTSAWQAESEANQTKAAADSKMGGATFVVFALCLIAVMIMGTVKLGFVLFG